MTNLNPQDLKRSIRDGLPSARIRRTANFNTVHNVSAMITMGVAFAVSWDRFGMFDAVNHRMYARRAGVYAVGACCEWDEDAVNDGQGLLFLRHQPSALFFAVGTSGSFLAKAAANNDYAEVHALYNFDVGEYCDLWAKQWNTGAANRLINAAGDYSIVWYMHMVGAEE